MLLIGVQGCGKRNIANLAAFTGSCEVFEVNLSRIESEEKFLGLLKQLYFKLLDGPTMFLISSDEVSV